MNKFRTVATSIFEGLGLEDSLTLCVKAEAVLYIINKMQEQKLTQTALAAQIGWRRSRLSDLMRGKINLFGYESINEVLAPFEAKIETNPKLLLPPCKPSTPPSKPSSAANDSKQRNTHKAAA